MRGEIVTNARVGEMCKMHHPRCRALIFQLEEKGCVATISKYAESRSATEFYLTPLGEEMLRLAIA